MVERRDDDHRASDCARVELSRLVVFKNKLPDLKAGEWAGLFSGILKRKHPYTERCFQILESHSLFGGYKMSRPEFIPNVDHSPIYPLS